jgi:hypothetical protein
MATLGMLATWVADWLYRAGDIVDALGRRALDGAS